jgi:hypothetical protein
MNKELVTYIHYPEIDEIFKYINKMDSFGKKVINDNSDLIRLDRPTQLTKKQSGIINEPDSTELAGRQIYNKYSELRDISTVMEHPEFFSFYMKYMRNPKDLKRILILMKLYHMISNYMYEHDSTEEHHNSYHKLVFLYKLISNPVYSRLFMGKPNEKNKLLSN